MNMKWTRLAAMVGGLLVIGLGIVVLVGWAAHLEALTRFLPSSTEMRRNTALGLVVGGLGLISLILRRKTPALVAGAFCSLLGLLTAAEFATGLDFGIDALLGKSYSADQALTSDRMSPTAAICFLLAGSAILSWPWNSARRFRSWIPGILASALAAIGLVSSLGYIFGNTDAYSLGEFTRIAFNSALAFGALGISLLIHAWGEGRTIQPKAGSSDNLRPLEWLPLSVGSGLLVATLGASQALLANGQRAHLLSEIALAIGMAVSVLLALAVHKLQKGKRSPESTMLTGVGLALAILLVVGMVQYRTIQNLIETDRWVAHTHEVLDELEKTAAAVGAMESEVRGYVATGDESFVDQQAAWGSQASEHIRRLRALTSDNTSQLASLDKLEPLVVKKVAFMQQQVAVRSHQGLDAAERMIATGDGRTLMKNIRALVALMGTEENGLLADRQTASHSSASGAARVTVLGNLLALAIVFMAGWIIHQDVVARARAEAALQRASAYNRSLIEASQDPLVTIAPDGKITDVNSATEKVTGHARRELIGTDFCKYFTNPQKAREGYELVFREGSVRDYELEICDSNGHTTPVLYNASVYRDEAGTVSGVFAAARDISERKRAGAALQQNAASLAQAQETAKMGSWEADVETRKAVWSAEMFRLTGFDPSMGSPDYPSFLEAVHPEDRHLLEETNKKVAQSGQGAQVEFRSDPARGPVRNFLGVVGPVRDKQGRVAGLSGILQDITERKVAEQTLRESEIKYRSVVENIPQKIFMKSRDYLWVSINENFARDLGIRPQEVIGKSDYDLYPKELADKYRADDKRIMESGVTEEFDEEYLRGNERRIVHTIKAPVRDQDGTIGGVLGVFWDVTDRRRTEKALQESEEQIHLLLNSAAEGIYGLDQEGNVTMCNRSCLELLGYQKPEDLLGKSIHALCHHSHPDGTPYPIEDCRAHSVIDTGEGAHVDDELYWRSDGTSFPAEYWSYPIRKDGQLIGCVVTFLDISLRRKAENDLRTLNQELEQRVTRRTADLEAANKELEAFTYSVSHDLRAPLRHIDGFSKMLMEEDLAGLSEDSKRYLGRIREGTRQMGQLVDDLLTMARLGRKELALQVTGLTSLVQEAAEEVKRENTGRQIEWKIEPLPFVECDPGLMKQVFVNLLSNAAKYSRPRAHAKIEVGAIEQNGQNVIFVRDNGVGFSMKYADKLFGVFQRLHRAEDFEGTGIGLATVQRILHKHGGRAWAEGEIDKGATFYFTLGEKKSEVGKQNLDEKGKAA